MLLMWLMWLETVHSRVDISSLVLGNKAMTLELLLQNRGTCMLVEAVNLFSTGGVLRRALAAAEPLGFDDW